MYILCLQLFNILKTDHFAGTFLGILSLKSKCNRYRGPYQVQCNVLNDVIKTCKRSVLQTSSKEQSSRPIQNANSSARGSEYNAHVVAPSSSFAISASLILFVRRSWVFTAVPTHQNQLDLFLRLCKVHYIHNTSVRAQPDKDQTRIQKCKTGVREIVNSPQWLATRGVPKIFRAQVFHIPYRDDSLGTCIYRLYWKTWGWCFAKNVGCTPTHHFTTPHIKY